MYIENNTAIDYNTICRVGRPAFFCIQYSFTLNTTNAFYCRVHKKLLLNIKIFAERLIFSTYVFNFRARLVR